MIEVDPLVADAKLAQRAELPELGPAYRSSSGRGRSEGSRSVIDAGPGNDSPIYAVGGDDVIHGGPGNDVLIGGTGNDAIDGGLGDDDFEGIPGEGLFGGNPPSQGTDSYVGSGGSDAVIYTGRGENLSLSLDGVANDGAPGENDNIHHLVHPWSDHRADRHRHSVRRLARVQVLGHKRSYVERGLERRTGQCLSSGCRTHARS